MRWYLTGSEGQLGLALRARLEARGEIVFGSDRELDVADVELMDRAIGSLEGGPPDVLVNAAALTQVDRCEREPELATRVNARAPAGLAEICLRQRVRLVHVSTDYVFDGKAAHPYSEDAAPSPTSVYGRTKWEGERAVRALDPSALVVRTSWVFGRGRNFVVAILEQARRVAGGEGVLRVVDDQRGRPTYAFDLAAGIEHLVERGARGVYHVANEGEASWWGVARAALDLCGLQNLPIARISTAELDLPAPRPAYSVLDLGKARDAGVPMRPWREALAAYLASGDAPPAATS